MKNRPPFPLEDSLLQALMQAQELQPEKSISTPLMLMKQANVVKPLFLSASKLLLKISKAWPLLKGYSPNAAV